MRSPSGSKASRLPQAPQKEFSKNTSSPHLLQWKFFMSPRGRFEPFRARKRESRRADRSALAQNAVLHQRQHRRIRGHARQQAAFNELLDRDVQAIVEQPCLVKRLKISLAFEGLLHA